MPSTDKKVKKVRRTAREGRPMARRVRSKKKKGGDVGSREMGVRKQTGARVRSESTDRT